jgi:hypothetical protein
MAQLACNIQIENIRPALAAARRVAAAGGRTRARREPVRAALPDSRFALARSGIGALRRLERDRPPA